MLHGYCSLLLLLLVSTTVAVTAVAANRRCTHTSATSTSTSSAICFLLRATSSSSSSSSSSGSGGGGEHERISTSHCGEHGLTGGGNGRIRMHPRIEHLLNPPVLRLQPLRECLGVLVGCLGAFEEELGIIGDYLGICWVYLWNVVGQLHLRQDVHQLTRATTVGGRGCIHHHTTHHRIASPVEDLGQTTAHHICLHQRGVQQVCVGEVRNGVVHHQQTPIIGAHLCQPHQIGAFHKWIRGEFGKYGGNFV
mmetsp:Transcript_5810/g.9553  ORF Transcript_5810/g.9553 Transcript_5810/m.9553 type:complete len:251 (-) Transcript_5810:1303-2055(-)